MTLSLRLEGLSAGLRMGSLMVEQAADKTGKTHEGGRPSTAKPWPVVHIGADKPDVPHHLS
jgi:hypothetical protein